MVPSFDALTPPGTWLKVTLAARVDGAWTKDYELGVWAFDKEPVARHSVEGQRDDHPGKRKGDEADHFSRRSELRGAYMDPGEQRDAEKGDHRKRSRGKREASQQARQELLLAFPGHQESDPKKGPCRGTCHLSLGGDWATSLLCGAIVSVM